MDIANGAADAVVARTNAPGGGVGSVAVQQYAERPPAESERGALVVSLGLATGLALAGLLVLGPWSPALT